MSDKQQFRLGLVGYGEIGSTLGKGLRGAGLQQIFCYDKYAFDGPYADLIQDRAKAAGVSAVVLDRGGYRYHGRVRSLTEGAREGGLDL